MCDLVFDRVPCWVQVYKIPIRFMNKVVVEGTRSGIGEVCPRISLIWREVII